MLRFLDLKILQISNICSPRVLRRKAYDQQVDIWSCGVLMFGLIKERDPQVCDSTLSGITYLGLKTKDCGLQGWSSNAKSILEKMMNADPDRRVSASDALAHEWFSK